MSTTPQRNACGYYTYRGVDILRNGDQRRYTVQWRTRNGHYFAPRFRTLREACAKIDWLFTANTANGWGDTQ